MNDLEKFKTIVQGRVHYKIIETFEKYEKDKMSELSKCIELQNTKFDRGNYLGYADFYSKWYFDKDGNFLGVGHYE